MVLIQVGFHQVTATQQDKIEILADQFGGLDRDELVIGGYPVSQLAQEF